jgi:hypothetical protein
MKEDTMINCPHCGKETPAGDVCQKCSKEIEFAQGMEVHYKDFKGSEMLDIKMASHARQEDEKQAQKNNVAADNGPRSEKKSAGKKAVFFFWATIGIILSALAWYYLLKFLPKF